MTYREQLLHPNWQRRRLEVMQQAGFACEECGAKDVTLNVHHRRYVKGRMAWEYQDSELACLCKDCHQQEHAKRELLDRLLMSCPYALDVAIGLLGGYLEGSLDLDEADRVPALEAGEPWFDAGILASILSSSGTPADYARAVERLNVGLCPSQENALERWRGLGGAGQD